MYIIYVVSTMFIRTMENILIVGAGITGAVTASLLRRQLSKKCCVTVWEKTKKIGGRMDTTEFPTESRHTVDLGAQYISTEAKYFNTNKSLYEELLSAGLLKPLKGHIEGDKVWPDGTLHFISPHGIGSLAKYYLDTSEAEIQLNHSVEEIQQEDDHYIARTSDGITQRFDCVVLTIPVPDILQIKGIISQSLDSKPEIKERLKSVQYSSRFAVGLLYKAGISIDVPWVAKYYRDDPVIVFIAVDNKKRGQETEGVSPSLLVHTSVPLTLKYINQDMDMICKEYILPRLKILLPELPRHEAIKIHLWKVSQVYKAYEGKPGVLVLQNKPLLVCGGDSFIDSTFDKCLESANILYSTIKENM